MPEVISLSDSTLSNCFVSWNLVSTPRMNSMSCVHQYFHSMPVSTTKILACIVKLVHQIISYLLYMLNYTSPWQSNAIKFLLCLRNIIMSVSDKHYLINSLVPFETLVAINKLTSVASSCNDDCLMKINPGFFIFLVRLHLKSECLLWYCHLKLYS